MSLAISLAHDTGAVSAGNLRERTRRALQSQIAAVAVDLILEQGLDNTTVEQIAAAAGIARSSFFRYFPTKEDVLFHDATDHGQRILDALTARPDDEPPHTALRNALDQILDLPTQDFDHYLRLARVFLETPALQARQYEKTLRWRELLEPEIARRMRIPDTTTDPRPTALISSTLACFDAALQVWVATNGSTPINDLVDLALSATNT
jgi:AcrR family transcriptional regulator